MNKITCHNSVIITMKNCTLLLYFIAECRLQNEHANDVVESTYALPEKTKKGPPTNKNISVRNMKAQIINMSLNENAGFKNEYHVRLFLN